MRSNVFIILFFFPSNFCPWDVKFVGRNLKLFPFPKYFRQNFLIFFFREPNSHRDVSTIPYSTKHRAGYPKIINLRITHQH